MKTTIKTLIALTLTLLMCISMFVACNDDAKEDAVTKGDETSTASTPDQEEPIKIEEQISSIKCKNELTSIIKNSKAQNNIKAEFDGGIEYGYAKIFNCYFNGTDSFAYVKKLGYTDSEYWAGKVNNEYLEFSKTYTTTVRTISQYKLEQTITRYKERVFDDYLGSLVIKSIEDAQGFECLKTTNGNIIVYQMKLVEFDSTENFTITVVDGLLTEVVVDDETDFICDYSGEKITLPNKNDCEIID